MIAGPDGVYICDECVDQCRHIIGEGAGALDRDTEPDLADMRPSGVKTWLDDHVVGQDRAKRALSVAVYNHYKRIRGVRPGAQALPAASQDVELSKGNILMIGPTGSGKTLLARTLARRLGVPFTMADATTLTEAGYVGEDVESIVKNLWLAASRDATLAGRGVVCIDEIDKIARSGGGSASMRDVGGEGVQQALLKIIESQNVLLSPDNGRGRTQQDLVPISTANILFMCCGAFVGLEDIVARRKQRGRIGFGADHGVRDPVQRRSTLLADVRPEDLVQYGLIPEFVGRLPVIVTLDELDADAMVQILWKPKNALVRQYRRLFELEGVKLRFHHEAMAAIVEMAIKRRAGARGLRSILEQVMLDVMYEVPSATDVRECVITEGVVRGTERPILTRGRKSA